MLCYIAAADRTFPCLQTTAEELLYRVETPIRNINARVVRVLSSAEQRERDQRGIEVSIKVRKNSGLQEACYIDPQNYRDSGLVTI